MAENVHGVVVVTAVGAANSDEAVAFVRAQLAAKLGDGEGQRWQAKEPHPLPRSQVRSVRAATRLDERGGPAA